MRLSQEEFESVNWDDFSISDIECLIDLGCITELDIQWYYRNTQWRDQS